MSESDFHIDELAEIVVQKDNEIKALKDLVMQVDRSARKAARAEFLEEISFVKNMNIIHMIAIRMLCDQLDAADSEKKE